MTVYLCTLSYHHQGTDLIGIATTLEKARELCEQHAGKPLVWNEDERWYAEYDFTVDYIITPCTLDTEVPRGLFI